MSILNDPRLTADGDAYLVTCCPDDDTAPTARIVPWVGGEWETYYVEGDPERKFHSSLDEAVKHLLGEDE